METPCICYQCLRHLEPRHSCCYSTTVPAWLGRCRDPDSHRAFIHATCSSAVRTCPFCTGISRKIPPTAPGRVLCLRVRNRYPDVDAEPLLREINRLAASDAATLANAGADTVCYVMVGSADTAETAVLALRAVQSLAKARGVCGVEDRGAVEDDMLDDEKAHRLCRGIERHSSDLSAAMAGLEAVAAVVEGSRAMQSAMAGAGGHELIHRAMRDHYRSRADIWIPGLRCLRAMLRGQLKHPNCDEPVLCNVSLLTEMIQTCHKRVHVYRSPHWTHIKALACEVAADLAVDGPSATLLHENNATGGVCAVLTKSPREEVVQVQGMRAAAGLCAHCPAARAFMSSFLPALLQRLLRCHAHSPAALEAALEVVAVLSLDHQGNAEAMLRIGMCEVIINALRRALAGSAAARAMVAMVNASPACANRLHELDAAAALTHCRERQNKPDAVRAEVNSARKAAAAALSPRLKSPRSAPGSPPSSPSPSEKSASPAVPETATPSPRVTSPRSPPSRSNSEEAAAADPAVNDGSRSPSSSSPRLAANSQRAYRRYGSLQPLSPPRNPTGAPHPFVKAASCSNGSSGRPSARPSLLPAVTVKSRGLAPSSSTPRPSPQDDGSSYDLHNYLLLPAEDGNPFL